MTTTNPNTLAGRLGTACVARLLPLLLLLTLPAAVQAKLNFNYTTHKGTITITRYTGSGGAVTIPDTINGLPVTSIGNDAFLCCTHLTSVTIPDSVTSIGNGAFYCCTRLTSVTIPYNVASIGIFAFSWCASLTGVYFQGDAPNIGSYVFYGDNHVSVYYLPGTTGWGGTFGGRPTALWYSPVPYTYTANNGTITITKYTGSGGAVTIPDTINGLPITSIGDNAFSLSGLTSVTIPNSVTSIGNYAFYYCSSLSSVTIGNSVTSVGDAAFAGCSSLSSVTIPNSITNIGDYVFENCTSLSSVTIPDSVTSIGVGAFDWCTSLSSVTIPDSVTSIGNGAFYYCPSLTGVYFQGNAPSIGGSYVFNGDNNATVYYLSGTMGWGPTFAGLPTTLWTP